MTDSSRFDATDVVDRYDSLLASIGDRADEIGRRPVVTHWPHVGSAYRGLVICGQAVFGWADDCQASDLRSATRRAEMIATIRSRVDKPEPLDWMESHPRRNTPFWKVARAVAEGLEPDLDAPWYARMAWVNLYPSAPEDPPDNPRGALKEAQDRHVGGLLRAVTDMLGARQIILVVGPYWWPAAGPAGLTGLPEAPRPLYRAGKVDGRTWVVGWHPKGASYRHFGPDAYAQILTDAARAVERDPLRHGDVLRSPSTTPA